MDGKSKIIKLSDFYAKKLNNYRDIYVYLPEGYDVEQTASYPVLYMHDGQNIFHVSDKSLSGYSWNVDRIADELIEQGRIRKLIIVGISNNTNRGGEYTHHSCVEKVVNGGALGSYKLSVEAKGLLYEDFIIHDLKPFIDSEFRTLQAPEDTAMLGSSMGGLVTYNIGFRNPDIFGNLGIMSPAFFWEDMETLSSIQKQPLKIWMDVGEGEDHYVSGAKEVADMLMGKGYISGTDLMFYQEPMAIHSELDWGKRIFQPLLYFFGMIGEPVSCRLMGEKTTGITGRRIRMNPIVSYDSGFMISQIDGNYLVENPEVLEVYKDGSIYGKAEGTTEVTFCCNGVSASSPITVVKELSDFVKITIHAQVPELTPADADVYLGTYVTMPLKLLKVGDKQYQGTFSFPRGLVVSFKFRREPDVFGKINMTLEKDCVGKDIGIRQFQALEDKELFYTVENWGDILR
jgi:predicted alpha/beta superfamily hydrolase